MHQCASSSFVLDAFCRREFTAITPPCETMRALTNLWRLPLLVLGLYFSRCHCQICYLTVGWTGSLSFSPVAPVNWNPSIVPINGTDAAAVPSSASTLFAPVFNDSRYGLRSLSVAQKVRIERGTMLH